MENHRRSDLNQKIVKPENKMFLLTAFYWT